MSELEKQRAARSYPRWHMAAATRAELSWNQQARASSRFLTLVQEPFCCFSKPCAFPFTLFITSSCWITMNHSFPFLIYILVWKILAWISRKWGLAFRMCSKPAVVPRRHKMADLHSPFTTFVNSLFFLEPLWIRIQTRPTRFNWLICPLNLFKKSTLVKW